MRQCFDCRATRGLSKYRIIFSNDRFCSVRVVERNLCALDATKYLRRTLLPLTRNRKLASQIGEANELESTN